MIDDPIKNREKRQARRLEISKHLTANPYTSMGLYGMGLLRPPRDLRPFSEQSVELFATAGDVKGQAMAKAVLAYQVRIIGAESWRWFLAF